ncbi:hypothetical protein LEP1GSC021_0288 [Leptospira noguchii str. 1993005606]|nr:hypothetical protein LEP1GSC021_0288 [Leptospira noguchii str. 1993005606]
MQVKRLILVGALEKCALIPKSSSIVGLVMVAQRLAPRTQQNAFYESVLGRSTVRV